VVTQCCLKAAACWAFVGHQDERLDIVIEMQNKVSSALATANGAPYRDIIEVISEFFFLLYSIIITCCIQYTGPCVPKIPMCRKKSEVF
jgi:hypothetical protein